MPYYGPDESPKDIFLERTFVAGDFVCGVGYGAQIVLYISCALFLWSQRKTRKQSLFLLVYVTLLIAIQSLFMVVQAKTVQDIYVDNRNYPGGPWAYFLATQSLPINVMFYATLFVLTFLSDILVLWRCWVIWTASGRSAAYIVIAFPALLLLASFVMGTLWTLESSQPGLSLYSSLPMAYGTVYYIISLSVNIILTILIIIRLLMYRRTVLATLPSEHTKQYVSLAAIMVESASLYSVLALIFIITYAADNPINQIFLGAASSGQQIAGYLIIYRLAEGRAWRKDTFTNQQLAPLDFGTPSKSIQTQTTMSAFRIDTGGLLSPPRVHTRDLSSTKTSEEVERDSPTLAGSPVIPIKENDSAWSRFRKSVPLQSTSMP